MCSGRFIRTLWPLDTRDFEYGRITSIEDVIDGLLDRRLLTDAVAGNADTHRISCYVGATH